MRKSKRSQVSFRCPVKNRNDARTLTVLYKRSFWPSPGFKESTFSYNNQLFAGHKAVGSVSSNHTSPKAYAMHAIVVDRGSFDYTVDGSHGSGASASSTPENGYGFPSHYTWGMLPAGGGYRPDVSENFVTQAVVEAKLKLNTGDLNLATSIAEARQAFNTINRLAKSMSALLSKLAGVGYVEKTVLKNAYSIRESGPRQQYVLTHRSARGEISQYIGKRQNNTLQHHFEYETLSIPPKWGFKGNVIAGAEKAWLEAIYGIVPMWMDMMGLFKFMGSNLAKPGDQLSALRVLERQGALPPVPLGYYQFKTSGKYTYGVECQLNYRMESPVLNTLANLGLLNPFALWWELTPYSFVIDWLLPIGNTLQALTADVGLQYVSGYTNTKSFCDFERECVKLLPGQHATGKLPNVRVRNVCQLRSVLVSPPSTGIYIKSPFSATHGISAIALLAQRIRK